MSKKFLEKNIECYLTCLNKTHGDILLPNRVPVVVGRMSELGITDKVCSRNQLELTSNYHSKYVLVKRLGANSSQIDGIEIKRNTASKLIPGQKLFIVNMKYPHCIKFEGDCDKQISGESATSHHDTTHSVPTSKRTRKGNKTEVAKKKLKVKNMRTKGNDSLQNESISEYSFKSNEDNQECSAKITLADTEKRDNKCSTSNHWSAGLKSAMEDPKSHVFQDEEVVVIKDKYPKAKFHWLVLPRKNIPSTKHLKQEHLPLVKHMLKVGEGLTSQKTDDSSLKSVSFRCGFHAIASMSQLHMHVISQDFISTFLKTKKHWNSFTTNYFVDATDIIAELETKGEVENRSSYKSLLGIELRCHVCGNSQKNMPTLKHHIQLCK